MSKRIPLWPVCGLRTTTNSPCPALFDRFPPATSPSFPSRSSLALRPFYRDALSLGRPYSTPSLRHVTTTQRPKVGVTTPSKFAFFQHDSFHPGPLQRAFKERLYSTKDDKPIPKVAESKASAAPDKASKTAPNPTQQPLEGEHESLATSVSKYLHLPHLPHRPTKEELLAAATGFWQRLKVRFKWASIRSMRPWNADEWGAFVSWFMLGHIVWILVGTTTFFSLLIFSINTVFAQGMSTSTFELSIH